MANNETITAVAGTDVPLRFLVTQTDVFGVQSNPDLTGAYCYFQIQDADGNILLTLDNDPAGANTGITIPAQVGSDLGAFHPAIPDDALTLVPRGKHAYFTLVRLDPGGADDRYEPARGIFCLLTGGVGSGTPLPTPPLSLTLAELNAIISDADVAISALPDVWTQANIAASQTDVALSRVASASFVEIVAVRDGSIVGLATQITEAITDATADSAIVTVTIDGTPATLALSHSSGVNPSGGVATQAPGIDTFTAGQLIGVEITTLASFLPTTADIEALVEIQH